MGRIRPNTILLIASWGHFPHMTKRATGSQQPKNRRSDLPLSFNSSVLLLITFLQFLKKKQTSCHSLPFWHFLKANQPLQKKIQSFPWPKFKSQMQGFDKLRGMWPCLEAIHTPAKTQTDRCGKARAVVFFAESWSGKDLQKGFGDCDFVETLCNIGISVDMTISHYFWNVYLVNLKFANLQQNRSPSQSILWSEVLWGPYHVRHFIHPNQI